MTKSRIIRILLTLFIVGYATFFSIQLILHFYSFGSRALDLGNMGQTIWNTSQGRLFHQTNHPGVTNRLSLHVEPILIPISLLYHIYSGPEILFVFQSIVVALGTIPVFALAHFKLRSQELALVFAAVYLMFPAIQGATLLDFHAVTLAPTFLLTAFYFLEIQRPTSFAIFAVLAAACKEEIALLVLMMGLYALIINRQYRLGLITMGLCVVWTYLAVFVIPPAFAETQNIHWDRYGHLGSSPIDIVLNIIQQPQLFLDHLQAVNALNYFRLLLSPTAFTALLNPIALLLALPSLGINLLSNFPPMQEVNSLIYAAPIVPAVMISSIYGVANLKKMGKWVKGRISEWRMAKIGRRTEDERPTTKDKPRNVNQIAHHASHATRYAIRNTNYASRIAHYVTAVTGLLILSATLLYHTSYGYFPGGGQFRGWEEVTDHHRRAVLIFSQIPSDAALSAQDRLNPHVSQRETLYIFDDQLEKVDHILLDVTQDSWPLHPLALRHRVDEFLATDFGIVDALDGYLLLARNQPDLPKTLPDKFFDFARVPNPDTFTPQFPVDVTFDDKIQLVGYSLSLGAHERFLPVITLDWRALEPLEKDYRLWPFFIDRNGQLLQDPAQHPLVTTLWYPTSRWSPDELIMTSTLPLELAPNIGDQFTLAVGVAAGEWIDPTQRLPITRADDPLYHFENNTWVRLNTFEHIARKTFQPVTEIPTTPQQSSQLQFQNIITLQGIDLPATSLSPGDNLHFTLYWQNESPITIDLTTFAHLRDNDGDTVAQLDWTPQDSLGYRPTSSWQPGRMVIDKQTISLPDNLPPGEYQLVVGWYFAPTGERTGEGKIGVISIQ